MGRSQPGSAMFPRLRARGIRAATPLRPAASDRTRAARRVTESTLASRRPCAPCSRSGELSHDGAVSTSQSGIFALGTASHAYLEFDGREGENARELVAAV